MDRFRRLKAYTPRIKLLVFGIGANAVSENVKSLSEDSSRESEGAIVSLGWFFLDLRTPDLPERWVKLQNSPFGGEILVSTTFTAYTGSTISELSALGTTRRESIEKPAGSDRHFTVDSLDARGLDEGDCLQLGDRGGSDVFIISVHIRGASRLSDLVHSVLPVQSKQPATLKHGFWLSYSLFEVVVQTDVFRNLDHPEFPAIRDSFRVKSCDEDLLSFIEQQRVLVVYLCTENRIIACAEIQLDVLSTSWRTKLGGDPALGVIESLDGVFGFSLPSGLKSTAAMDATISIECTKRALSEQNTPGDITGVHSAKDDDRVADAEEKVRVTEQSAPVTCVVDVSTIRLKASLLTKFVGNEAVMLELLIGDQAIRHPIRFDAFGNGFLLGYCDRFEVKSVAPRGRVPSVSVSCCSNESDELLAVSAEGSIQDGETIRLPLQRDGNLLGECILCPQILISDDVSDQQGTRSTAVLIVPGATRRYRVSIHLKSVRDFASSSAVSFSYVNPFTGKQRVETPVVTTAPKAEVTIPDGQCTFDFFGDEAQLRSVMESPVVIEMHSMQQDSSSGVVGSAVFSLNYLYFSEMHFGCTSPECDVVCKSKEELLQHVVGEAGHGTPPSALHHTLKSCSIYLPLMGAGVLPTPSTMSRVGAVRVIASLQDLGIMQSNECHLVEKM
ncbi:hypothetical protein PINS_up008706 [Pythium insidiosum]|nr:hypothetical protein PINS_up008706 [Pythium insidiosum]